MLTKLRLALLISAPLVGAATLALAGDGPAHDAVIQKFDKNSDGKLDDAERAAMHAAFKAKGAERHQAMLAKFDKNGDGKLDATERAAMRDALATERFQAMDKNGDGVLSLDEFKAGAGKAGMHRHGRHGHGHGKHRAAPANPATGTTL
jgi:EF hand